MYTYWPAAVRVERDSSRRSSTSSGRITPSSPYSNYYYNSTTLTTPRTSSFSDQQYYHHHRHLIIPSDQNNKKVKVNVYMKKSVSFLRTIFLNFLSPPNSIQQQQIMILPLKKVATTTCTLFGYRRGHVSFAVHLYDPKTTTSDPILLLQLPISTAALLNDMASGLVRISLECHTKSDDVLMKEPAWSMYCNGRKCGGKAVARWSYTALDSHVLNTVSSVSVGAGVIPPPPMCAGGGELLYMRAKFERVVAGSRDSEAFHMLNPDRRICTGSGPELSLFFLRF